ASAPPSPCSCPPSPPSSLGASAPCLSRPAAAPPAPASLPPSSGCAAGWPPSCRAGNRGRSAPSSPRRSPRPSGAAPARAPAPELARALGEAGGAVALRAGGDQRAGVAAFRVVGAADEGPGPSEPEAQPATRTGRAGPRVGAVATLGEEVRPQLLVQRVDDVA